MSANNEFLNTCDPNLTPLVARRERPFTPRRAVDSTGCLGSFYDACYDTVLQTPKISLPAQMMEKSRELACGIKSIESNKPINLLASINMSDELRLSVVLKMTKEMGIGELINYSHQINKYTRLISYSSLERTEYLSEDEFHSLANDKRSIPDASATHVIVLVNWGIDATAVVQLPSDESLTKNIEMALGRLCKNIKHGDTSGSLSQSDKSLFEQIHYTEIYSNIPELSKLKSIIEFCDEISCIKKHPKRLKPYNYNLCSIQHFYTINNNKQIVFIELKPDIRAMIEEHMVYLLYNFNKLQRKMDDEYSNVKQLLKVQVLELREKYSKLNERYTQETESTRQKVLKIRRDVADQIEVDLVFNSENIDKLTKAMNDLSYDIDMLVKKEAIINEILARNFEYRAVSDNEIDRTDTKETIKKKLLMDKKYQRIVYFNDFLYNKNREKQKSIYAQLEKEQQQTAGLKILFVDFTYSWYQPKDFVVLSQTDDETPPSTPRPTTARPTSTRKKTDPHINILLIGETGVGKSTFINAFVNYFTFDRLRDAKKDPIVLIPFSFLITTGSTFQERQVTFGDITTFKNEDFTKPGQSVTQHCKSYIFPLDNEVNREKNKLRIIDTPGIGDVRGTIQDDINMQHILSYISNFTDVHAVCILLKPNENRLNIFLRSCFLQLINFLGDSIRDKIIFCFTNSRSTFFAPGNTGPILKSLIKSLPGEEIHFSKKNTFCFDSESFRYLVAKQNGITFDDIEETQYDESWTKSTAESKRFLNYLRNEMIEPLKTTGNTSTKNAQLQINGILRPLLETMRNNLRNFVLLENGSSKALIQLRPRTVKDFNGICLTCPRPLINRGGISILSDALHVFHNNCRTCECEANDHYSIDYQLEYDSSNPTTSIDKNQLSDAVNKLCKISAEFACFLTNEIGTIQGDPFLLGIERILKEEKSICGNKTDSKLNTLLLEDIYKLKTNYESIKKELVDNKRTMKSLDVFKKIQELRDDPIIEMQMKIAEEWHKFMFKQSEKEIEM